MYIKMGRKPCCWRAGLRKGAWTLFEDKILSNYISRHGASDWRDLPRKAGLGRCGKSCRLRWVNYLKPDLKRGCIAPDEEDLIIKLHNLLGNRWSLIAGRLPGRTDNEIKNHWNCKLRKRVTKNKDHIDEVTRATRVRSPPRQNQNHEVVRPRAVRCTRAIKVPHAPDHRDGVISGPIPRHGRDQEYDRDTMVMFDLDLNGCYDPFVGAGDRVHRDTVESSVLDLWISPLEEDLILREGSGYFGAMDLDFSMPNWALQ